MESSVITEKSETLTAEAVSEVKEKKDARQRLKKLFSTQNLVKMAVFTALSIVLYFFAKFQIPFMFPTFLEFQVSDLPALIAGFMMGPAAGCVIVIVKILIKLPFSGTGCVGELGDLIIGLSFVLPAALIYKFNKNKKGALIGIAAGILSSTAAAMLVNRFILIPFFVGVAGGWETLLNMFFRVLFPNITQQSFYAYYLPLTVLPFNILRGVVTGAITYFTYKRLGRLFNFIVPDDGYNHRLKGRKRYKVTHRDRNK